MERMFIRQTQFLTVGRLTIFGSRYDQPHSTSTTRITSTEKENCGKIQTCMHSEDLRDLLDVDWIQAKKMEIIVLSRSTLRNLK